MTGPRRVRVTRSTADLKSVSNYYARSVGLPILTTFRDHDGFDGDIFKVDRDLEFEITAGPPKSAPATHRSAWILGQVSPAEPNEGMLDPDGFHVRIRTTSAPTVDQRCIFERPTLDAADTRSFYEQAFGLVVGPERRGVVDYGLTSGRPLLRTRIAEQVPPPDIEDLLVLTYGDGRSRDAAADAAIRLGASIVRPHNPWWHHHAVCVRDSDGFTTALGVAAPG